MSAKAIAAFKWKGSYWFKSPCGDLVSRKPNSFNIRIAHSLLAIANQSGKSLTTYWRSPTA
ncbi:MAG TPA: hypothetical protein V6D48_12590 [Oculatellaceae cyanobacterium]